MTYGKSTCYHNGGIAIGAGHRCVCNRESNHPFDSDRPHGCSCGAIWADKPTVFKEVYMCPTLCDFDCEQQCHEWHEVPWKRTHDVYKCIAKQLT